MILKFILSHRVRLATPTRDKYLTLVSWVLVQRSVKPFCSLVYSPIIVPFIPRWWEQSLYHESLISNDCIFHSNQYEPDLLWLIVYSISISYENKVASIVAAAVSIYTSIDTLYIPLYHCMTCWGLKQSCILSSVKASWSLSTFKVCLYVLLAQCIACCVLLWRRVNCITLA